MDFPVRYADGRAAVTHDARCTFGDDGLTVSHANGSLGWTYKELRRADDNNGRLILKRRPDTGERLYLDSEEAGAELKRLAPSLFTPAAHGVEHPAIVGTLIACAASLATAFLIGVPMAAEPIAGMLPPTYRGQISDISWSQVNAFTQVCDDSDQANDILNDLAYRLMDNGHVGKKDDVWVTIVQAPIPNAFALPDNSIVVTDQLIAMAEDPDELAGVLAHEIAHIEHNHVMSNVIRNIGAGIFFDVVFGGAGAGQAIAIASVNLAGLRYGRGDEAEADAEGLNYLDAANVDPGKIAALFDRIAKDTGETNSEIANLLSSHPASAERAALARARAHPERPPSLTPAQWRVVRTACGGTAQAPARQAQPETPAPSQPPVQTPAPDVAPAPKDPTE